MRKLWHQIRVRPRLTLSAIAGLAALALLPTGHMARSLLAWDLGAGLYLALGWTMMFRASVDHMKWRARVQDDGASVVLFLTVAAALASIAAIAMELSNLKTLPLPRQGLRLGLVALTFAASWFLVHTAFALHYAHVYYVEQGRDHAPSLEFPRQESPVYIDFMYFAMVIAMTSQTADVAIASTRMRRLAMMQGLIAFAFNTTLLALTINIAAGLLG